MTHMPMEPEALHTRVFDCIWRLRLYLLVRLPPLQQQLQLRRLIHNLMNHILVVQRGFRHRPQVALVLGNKEGDMSFQLSSVTHYLPIFRRLKSSRSDFKFRQVHITVIIRHPLINVLKKEQYKNTQASRQCVDCRLRPTAH